MGLLDFFSKSEAEEPLRLPSGTFTVDREGHVLTSTLPQRFPEEHVHEIARQVLYAFQGARRIQHPVSELVIRYSGFKITARELRGGALVFLAPQSAISV